MLQARAFSTLLISVKKTNHQAKYITIETEIIASAVFPEIQRGQCGENVSFREWRLVCQRKIKVRSVPEGCLPRVL